MLKADEANECEAGSWWSAGLPHFAPKAKRAIYLHMLGAPPQLETFDYKPGMEEWFDKDLPESIRSGQRLTTMTSGQTPISHRAIGLQVPAIRKKWRMGFGTAALHGQDGGRYRHHSLHAYGGDQSRTGHHLSADRFYDRRQAMHRFVARLRAGQHESVLPTFVVLNATHSNPKANVQAISARSGVPDSSPGSIQASRCDPAAIPFCISTIRMECLPRSAGGCWMRWAN